MSKQISDDTHQLTFSTKNSTTTPLASSATFTGGWDELLDFNSISIISTTDEIGTLYADFSIDGVTTDREIQLSSGTAVISSIHSLVPVARFMRVRLVNGSTTQGLLRIQTLYSRSPRIALPTSRLAQSVMDYSDVLNTRAVSVGQGPNGEYCNSKIDGVVFETTTPLAPSGSYVSEWVFMVGYSQVQTHILASHDGTFVVEFASDSVGADVVRTLTVPYTALNGYKLYSAPLFANYGRWTFTNTSVSTQTDFFFETVLRTKAVSGQLLDLESFLNPSMIANLGRNVIVAKDKQNIYTNVKSDYNGHLYVSQKTNVWAELAIDEILDTYGDTVIIKPKTLFKYGTNPDCDSGVPETIWTQGGDETFATGNTIDTIVSTSSSDTGTVKVEGHTLSGSDFTFVVQEVTLTGQTNVVLGTPIARCSRVYNTNGTDLVGKITVFDDTAGSSSSGVVTPVSAIHCTIAAGFNQSAKCQTTFSSVDYGILTQLTGGISSKTGSLADFVLQVRESGGVWRNRYAFGSTGATTTINLEPYLIVPKNADIRIRGESGTNNTGLFASFNSIFGLIQS